MRPIRTILGASTWSSMHELLHDQVVHLEDRNHHHIELGISFPAAPMNGAV